MTFERLNLFQYTLLINLERPVKGDEYICMAVFNQVSSVIVLSDITVQVIL